MNDHQAAFSEKRFQIPKPGSNPQPCDDLWAAQTIELLRLIWWAKMGWHTVCATWAEATIYVNNDIDETYILEVWELGDILRW